MRSKEGVGFLHVELRRTDVPGSHTHSHTYTHTGHFLTAGPVPTKGGTWVRDRRALELDLFTKSFTYLHLLIFYL